MYIYKQQPHAHQPLEGEHAPASGAMNTDPSSQSPSHIHHHAPASSISASGSSLRGPSLPPAISSVTSPPPEPPVVSIKHSSVDSRRHSLPFSFPPLFFKPSNNKSSTSLVPSTAEGKPIPLDNDTTAHRTSALRELNSNYPSSVSRHRYAKSTGAQNSTYSQPVIVRTYSGPSPLQGHSRSNSHAGSYRPPSASRAGSRRVPYSVSSTSTSYFSPSAHTKPPIKAPQNGSILSMARGNAKKKAPWSWRQESDPQSDPAKLPPLEAYSFKSFMATFDEQHSGVGADLDRIAEICARSRYSLSNQYEVHVKPHGSGTSFIASSVPSSSRRRGNGRNNQREPGPTLQAIQSDDDESNARSHRKRRSGGRRRSVAYGTLETIMSSSRSSEEDKTKKKSAAEIAEEVRGRAARKSSDSKSGGSASGSPSTGAAADKSTSGTTSQAEPKTPARKKSTAFANAIIHAENTRLHPAGDATSPRNSASALVSQPALPQTSSSHLEIRTAPDEQLYDDDVHDSQPQSPHSSAGSDTLFSPPMPPVNEPKTTSSNLLSGLSNLIPWRTATSGPGGSATHGQSTKPSHAEGSLRDLLKTVNGKQDKGKSVERAS